MLIFQYKTNILGVGYIQYGQNTKQQNVHATRAYQKQTSRKHRAEQ